MDLLQKRDHILARFGPIFIEETVKKLDQNLLDFKLLVEEEVKKYKSKVLYDLQDFMEQVEDTEGLYYKNCIIGEQNLDDILEKYYK